MINIHTACNICLLVLTTTYRWSKTVIAVP